MATEMSTTGAGVLTSGPAVPCPTPEEEPGKLFVGGLSWKTTKDSLRLHFSKYGELEDCTVMVDKDGQPRGFGFIKYRNHEHAKAALCAPDCDQMLDGKKIDPKPATKNSQNGPVKVFVGGLPTGVTEEELKAAFIKFGQIVEGQSAVTIKMDHTTQRSRGFAFVTFVSKSSADAAVQQHWVNVKDKQVEVKVAENQRPKGAGMSYPSGGYNDGSAYGYANPYSHDRHMTQQQPAAYHHYPGQQYPHQHYQQHYSSYPQGGYSNGSGGYMYGQSASTHSQAMNSYEGFNGYPTTRDSGYPPQHQQYSYTGQQQPTAYGGTQATHTGGYPRAQQGATTYNSYPVHQ